MDFYEVKSALWGGFHYSAWEVKTHMLEMIVTLEGHNREQWIALNLAILHWWTSVQIMDCP